MGLFEKREYPKRHNRSVVAVIRTIFKNLQRQHKRRLAYMGLLTYFRYYNKGLRYRSTSKKKRASDYHFAINKKSLAKLGRSVVSFYSRRRETSKS